MVILVAANRRPWSCLTSANARIVFTPPIFLIALKAPSYQCWRLTDHASIKTWKPFEVVSRDQNVRSHTSMSRPSRPPVCTLLSLTPDVKTLIIENTPTPSNDNSTTYDSSSDQIELVHLRKLVLRCQCDGNCSTLGFLKAP